MEHSTMQKKTLPFMLHVHKENVTYDFPSFTHSSKLFYKHNEMIWIPLWVLITFLCNNEIYIILKYFKVKDFYINN